MPPLAASYQFKVPPAQPDAERLTIPGPHLELFVTAGAAGNGFTVTVTWAVPAHPNVVPVTVYVVVPGGVAVTVAPVVGDNPVMGLQA